MENLELLRISGTFLQANLTEVKQVIAIRDGIVVYNGTKLFLYENANPTDEIIVFTDSDEEVIKTHVSYLRIVGKLWFGTDKYQYFYTIANRRIIRIDKNCDYIFGTWNPVETTLIAINADLEVKAFLFDHKEIRFFELGSCSLNDVPTDGLVPYVSGNSGILNTTHPFMDDVPMPTNNQIYISWQDDGEFYAINYKHEDDRLFKVLKYPAEVYYIAQYPLGVQEPIAWKPVRNIIATHIHTETSSEIAIFERNGQLLEKFDLENNHKVMNISWSPDGQLLMIQQQNGTSSTISLYMNKNLKWYLKLCLEFSNKKIISTEFARTELNVYKLRINLSVESLEYTFKKIIARSKSGKCAVIVGNEVHIFDFNDAIMPPPLIQRGIRISNPVNFVMFGQDGYFLAIDSKNMFHWYDFNREHEKLKEVTLTSVSPYPLSVKPFLWEDTIVYCNNTKEDLYEEILHFDLAQDTTNLIQGAPGLEEALAVIRRRGYQRQIYLSVDDISRLYNETEYTINIVVHEIDGTFFIVHQTTQNTLFINKTQVASNVNSFMLYAKYILVTRTNGNLYAIPLEKKDLYTACLTRDISDWYIRDVEAGSILINGIPNSCKIVLQMERGNLEIIRFDLGGLTQLEDMLNEHKWKKAIDMIRIDKLSSDILIDLNTERFLNNIDKVIHSVNSVAVINSILLELQDGNSLKCYNIENVRKVDLKDKKQVVCKAIANYVKAFDCIAYVSTLMICYYTIEDFHAAFKIIGEYLEMYEYDVAKAAVEVLLQYMPNMSVFKYALETFDINLIEFVAKNSRLNPLEYDNILRKVLHAKNELQDDDETMFVINDYLQRPKLAIFSLMFQKNVDWNRVMEYINLHKLYKETYSYYFLAEKQNRDTESYKKVATEYGNYLIKKKSFDEAAIIFSKAEMYEQAFACYKSAEDWNKALYTLKKLKYPKEKCALEYELLATEMIRANKPKEASKIYMYHLKSYDRAIDVLISHNLYVDAVELAKDQYNDDAMFKTVYPALLEYTKQLMSSLESYDTKLDKYVDRLQKLRDIKFANLELIDSKNNEDFNDTESIASNSTASTHMTNITTASERYKRKQELRKQDLRENGAFEDIALIRMIYITMTDVFELTKDAKSTCMLFLEANEDYFKIASSFQSKVMYLYEKIEKYCIEVWADFLYKVAEGDSKLELLKGNFEHIDQRYSKPPELPEKDWVTILLG